MSRRKPGHASVEEHPKGSGRYRVRARLGEKLKTIVSGATQAEAEECAAAYAVKRGEVELRQGITLRAFGAGFLDRRELSGIRAIRTDRNRWARYVDGDPIGNLPIATLARRDVVEWRDRMLKRKLAAQTIKNALNLLRVALQEALDRDLLPANPARDVRVPRRASNTTELELDGVLTPDEQARLLSVVPWPARHVVAFALYTGLRQAEQWWLQWPEVGSDRVVVRYSVGGKPPKSGKPRVVYLLPEALKAIEDARKIGNPRWVFAGKMGGRREQGKKPRGWRRWLKAAGITRRVRWHDLRHTCATSLLAGWWGRRWSIEEVCAFLGHSSVTVTERYARKVTELQAVAVRETASSQLGSQSAERDCESGVFSAAPPARVELATNGLGRRGDFPKSSAGSLRAVFPPGNSRSLTPAAWALVQAAERALRGVA